MNQRNENFSMILEVLENINMKPNKESLSYVDKFIQSNGGYKQYYDSYNEYKIQKERISILQLEKSKENNFDLPIIANPSNEEILPEKRIAEVTLSNENHILPNQYFVESTQTLLVNNKTESFNNKNETNPSTKQHLELQIDDVTTKKPTLKPKPAYQLDQNSTRSDAFIFNDSQTNATHEKFKIEKSARNPLLSSIENFNGNLKNVDSDKESRIKAVGNNKKLTGSNEQNDIITQLFKALDDMRPYLSKKYRIFF
jgi:hypothetical protein